MNRIYRSLRSIDWKHGLGEVSLIIVGILAALAVDAWWDSHKDDDKARAYLHQLLVDVDANESAIGELIGGHSKSANAATRLESAFDAEGPLPPCGTMAEIWRFFEPRQPSDPQPWAGCAFEPLRRDPDVREALFSIHLLHENRIGFANELAAANRQLRVPLGSELGVAAPEARPPAR